jgi:hypothetical protein
MEVGLFPADGQTDRHDETVTFGNFANAPKMKSGSSNYVLHRTGLAVR